MSTTAIWIIALLVIGAVIAIRSGTRKDAPKPAPNARGWAIGYSPGMSQRATNTAIDPLPISDNAVSRPTQKPAARMAFVPPVRPLPTARTSCPVNRRTHTRPDGIEPIR